MAFLWLHWEPCLCPASSSLSGFSAFPAESLATADVPFRHFNFFFFLFSCQYLSHLFPESAAAPKSAPKSASVTFRFEVFRTCLLGKHLPCLPAQTLTGCPSGPFTIRFPLLQRALLYHEVADHQLTSSINRLGSNNRARRPDRALFTLPCRCSQRRLLPPDLSSAPKVPFPLAEGVPALNSSPPYLPALQLSVAAEDSLFSLPGGDTRSEDSPSQGLPGSGPSPTAEQMAQHHCSDWQWPSQPCRNGNLPGAWKPLASWASK